MTTTTRRTKGTPGGETVRTTVALPAKLHRAVRTLAAEQDRTIQAVFAEALRLWIEHQEELEDAAAYDAAKAEDAASGEAPIPWEQARAEMKAARAAMGDPDPDEEAANE